MIPCFNTSHEYSRMYVWFKFVIPAQICDKLSRGQAKLPRILSQMAKITLKIKVNVLHFQYQLRVSHEACLVLTCWFQLKSVISYRADKLKLTGKQKGRQTDRRRQRQYPFGLKGPKVKTCIVQSVYMMICAKRRDQPANIWQRNYYLEMSFRCKNYRAMLLPGCADTPSNMTATLRRHFKMTTCKRILKNLSNTGNVIHHVLYITVPSTGARWRLKSPAFPLFAQLLVQAQIKENINAPSHWP